MHILWLHRDGLEVRFADGVCLSVLRPVVWDPLWLILCGTVRSSSDVRKWLTYLEQTHGNDVVRCIQSESMIDSLRQDEQVTRQDVNTNPVVARLFCPLHEYFASARL